MFVGFLWKQVHWSLYPDDVIVVTAQFFLALAPSLGANRQSRRRGGEAHFTGMFDEELALDVGHAVVEKWPTLQHRHTLYQGMKLTET